MADHEVKITPHIDLTEMRDWQRHLAQVEQQMARIAASAAKIKVDTGGSGSGGSGGGTTAPQPGTRPARPSPAEAQAEQVLPHTTRKQRQRQGAGGSNANNPGGLLNWMLSVFLPDQPTIQEMTRPMQHVGAQKIQRARNTQSVLARAHQLRQQSGGELGTATAANQIAQEEGFGPLGQYGLRRSAERVHQWQQAHGHFAAFHAHRLQAAQAAATGGSSGGGGGRAGLHPGLKSMLEAGGLGVLADLTPWALGAAGVGFVGSQVRQGWSTYHTQGTAFSALSKSVGDLGESFNTLRNRVNETGLQFAETLPTITQAMQTFAPYVGNIGTRGLVRDLTASQGLAFSYGLNPVSTTQAFGQAAQIGILGTNSSRGQMTAAQWATLIANATASGSMQGRQGQVLSSMLSVSQQIAQQIAQAPNQNLIASIMTGLNQSGNPNLQGTLGAQLLGNINQGIQHPGMGTLGQLISYQALNPNNKLGYFQEKYLQAQGLNGINPTTGVSNFAAELSYFQKYLSHGKVAFMPGSHGTMPTESTALAAAMLGNQWNITQPQALQVLQAFNGKTLSSVNQTALLAQKWGGPNALQTLLHKNATPVFSGIANATGVGGSQGLNALAHEVTGKLHGTVSPHFWALEKQYKALGAEHPANRHQAAAIAHQRASDLQQMKKSLGQSVLGGPTLLTSMDQLNRTLQQANKYWANIGNDLKPLAQVFANLDKGIAQRLSHPVQSLLNFSGLSTLLQAIHHPHAMERKFSHANGRSLPALTMSYALPGLSAQSPNNGMGATLASFVQSNQQSTFLASLAQLFRGTSSGGGAGQSPYQVASYHGSSSASQTAFIQQMLPYAQQVANATGLPKRFLLTQWADETGFGSGMAGKNNYGNIKVPGTNTFQSYTSPEAFAQADAAFYNNNPRYQALLQGARHGDSLTQLFQLLGQSGYATNPQYAQDLMGLVGQIQSLLTKIERNQRTGGSGNGLQVSGV